MASSSVNGSFNYSSILLGIQLNKLTIDRDPTIALKTLQGITHQPIELNIAPETLVIVEKIRKMILSPEKYCTDPQQYAQFKASITDKINEKIKAIQSTLTSSTPVPSTTQQGQSHADYFQYLLDRVANLEAWAQYEMGCKYHDPSDEHTIYSPQMAVIHYELAAAQGYPEAQYRLAHCLRYGDGTECNFDASIQLLESAAQQGYFPAQYALGVSLINLSHANFIPGLALINDSANNGYSEAQFTIGLFYEFLGPRLVGDDNMRRAVTWYFAAAEQGDMHAQFKIGYFYQFGLGGLEKNPTESMKWYLASANLGSGAAKRQLEMIWSQE